MATRSGKPYNHENKTPRRRHTKIDTTIDNLNTSNVKEVDTNLNNSNMSPRELRGKRAKVKEPIIDKNDLPKKKSDAGQATESNWIVSEVPVKGKKRKTNAKAAPIEKDEENDINMSNIPPKTHRKSSNNVDINTIDEQDIDMTTGNGSTVKEDIENAEAVSDKQMKKKKKKVKGGKKKKSKAKVNKVDDDDEKVPNEEDMELAPTKQLKGKNSVEKMTVVEQEKIVNTTYDKEENKDRTFDKSATSLNASKNIVKDVCFNSSVSKKRPLKRKSIAQDTTFDNPDKVLETTLEKEGTNDLDLDFIIANKNLRKRMSIKDTTFDKSDTVLETVSEKDGKDDLDPDSKVDNKNLKKRMSIKDTTFDKSDNILETTYDKDVKDSKIENGLEINFSVSNKKLRTRKSINTTFDKDENNSLVIQNNVKELQLNDTNVSNKQLRSRKSLIKDTTFEKIDTTYEKNGNNKTFDNLDSDDTSNVSSNSKVNINNTYDNVSTSFNTFKKGAITRRSSIQDDTCVKTNTQIHNFTKAELKNDNFISGSATKRKSGRRQTIDITETLTLDSTYEKPVETESKRNSKMSTTEHILNTTFEKDNGESKSSLISSDNSVSDKSEISRISITSDESSENIINTTPLLIESSMDETLKESPKSIPPEVKPQTPIKREGTFTKDIPEIQPQSPLTPKRSSAVTAAGCTPYHVGKSSQKKPMLNITRSIEKRLSVEPAPRLTRVMFCSPVDNPVIQEKRKVIKSNLKGSNKSFVFDDSVSLSRPAARKRSYTHNDVDDSRAKRTRLADDLQQSVDRLSRPRTGSVTAKANETTPKKQSLPFKSKSESKSVRTRLPNFAALHQRQFDKMESLDECQERKAKRARQMLTPNGAVSMLERISPKNNTEQEKPKEAVKPTKEIVKPKDKVDTPKKSFTLESLKPGFTRFGFKLNIDVNPFSIPAKTEKKYNVSKNVNLAAKNKVKLNGTALLPKIPLPSLAGTTSLRREVAKQTVMREKSFLDKRKQNRNENRTIIKGVRTNRRFELQMKLRNIE